MKRNGWEQIARFRVTSGPYGTTDANGNEGLYRVPLATGEVMTVFVSDGRDWREAGLPGEPWEHVSVSLGTRCPTWEELEYVRQIFWEADETVVQLHVPRRRHVNTHPYCLHLWRPTKTPIPLPPRHCV